MQQLIDAVSTLLTGIEYAQKEMNANYVITNQDIDMLKQALQQCSVISCNDLTPKERLSKKLAEITQESKNLKLMHEYFGKENIERLPFKNISIGGLYTNSWDGSHTLDVNFVTGRVHQSCTVADVGDILITESELKIIEEAIHVRLGKL